MFRVLGLVVAVECGLLELCVFSYVRLIVELGLGPWLVIKQSLSMMYLTNLLNPKPLLLFLQPLQHQLRQHQYQEELYRLVPLSRVVLQRQSQPPEQRGLALALHPLLFQHHYLVYLEGGEAQQQERAREKLLEEQRQHLLVLCLGQLWRKRQPLPLLNLPCLQRLRSLWRLCKKLMQTRQWMGNQIQGPDSRYIVICVSK